jgi:hypothetical protein
LSLSLSLSSTQNQTIPSGFVRGRLARALALIGLVAGCGLLTLGCGRTASVPRRARDLGVAPAVDAGSDEAPDLDCARNACGTCGPAPVEECNGRDDDCDGIVDNGCVEKLAPALGRSVSWVRIVGDDVLLARATRPTW